MSIINKNCCSEANIINSYPYDTSGNGGGGSDDNFTLQFNGTSKKLTLLNQTTGTTSSTTIDNFEDLDLIGDLLIHTQSSNTTPLIKLNGNLTQGNEYDFLTFNRLITDDGATEFNISYARNTNETTNEVIFKIGNSGYYKLSADGKFKFGGSEDKVVIDIANESVDFTDMKLTNNNTETPTDTSIINKGTIDDNYLNKSETIAQQEVVGSVKFNHLIDFESQIQANNGINANNKKITNVANPVDDTDAVNKQFVISHITDTSGIHIVNDQFFLNTYELSNPKTEGGNVYEKAKQLKLVDNSGNVNLTIDTTQTGITELVTDETRVRGILDVGSSASFTIEDTWRGGDGYNGYELSSTRPNVKLRIDSGGFKDVVEFTTGEVNNLVPLNMNDEKITNVADPVDPKDAVNLESISTFLKGAKQSIKKNTFFTQNPSDYPFTLGQDLLRATPTDVFIYNGEQLSTGLINGYVNQGSVLSTSVQVNNGRFNPVRGLIFTAPTDLKKGGVIHVKLELPIANLCSSSYPAYSFDPDLMVQGMLISKPQPDPTQQYISYNIYGADRSPSNIKQDPTLASIVNVTGGTLRPQVFDLKFTYTLPVDISENSELYLGLSFSSTYGPFNGKHNKWYSNYQVSTDNITGSSTLVNIQPNGYCEYIEHQTLTTDTAIDPSYDPVIVNTNPLQTTTTIKNLTSSSYEANYTQLHIYDLSNVNLLGTHLHSLKKISNTEETLNINEAIGNTTIERNNLIGLTADVKYEEGINKYFSVEWTGLDGSNVEQTLTKQIDIFNDSWESYSLLPDDIETLEDISNIDIIISADTQISIDKINISTNTIDGSGNTNPVDKTLYFNLNGGETKQSIVPQNDIYLTNEVENTKTDLTTNYLNKTTSSNQTINSDTLLVNNLYSIGESRIYNSQFGIFGPRIIQSITNGYDTNLNLNSAYDRPNLQLKTIQTEANIGTTTDHDLNINRNNVEKINLNADNVKIKNGNLKMSGGLIDMSSNRIINVADGSNNNDVVNVGQLNQVTSDISTNYLNKTTSSNQTINSNLLTIKKQLLIESDDNNQAILTLKSNQDIISGTSVDEADMHYIDFIGDRGSTYTGTSIGSVARIQIQKEWVAQNAPFDQFRSSCGMNFIIYDSLLPDPGLESVMQLSRDGLHMKDNAAYITIGGSDARAGDSDDAVFINSNNLNVNSNRVKNVSLGGQDDAVPKSYVDKLHNISIFRNDSSFNITDGSNVLINFNETIVNQLNLDISGSNNEFISPSLDISGQMVEIYLNVLLNPSVNNTNLQLDISSVMGTSFFEEIGSIDLKNKTNNYYITLGPHIFIPDEWSGSQQFVFKLTADGGDIDVLEEKLVFKSYFV